MHVEWVLLRDLACDRWPDFEALQFSQHLFVFHCLLIVGAIASSYFESGKKSGSNLLQEYGAPALSLSGIQLVPVLRVGAYATFTNRVKRLRGRGSRKPCEGAD